MKLKQNKHRNGAVLVVVLVCLGVITALIFTALQTSLRHRRQLDRELQMEQTRLLAEAGLAHGMKIAKDDPTEKTVVITPQMDNKITTEVTIKLTKVGDQIGVSSAAWIGLKDRPETQTRQTLKTELKPLSEEQK